jgi:hypothetical protein
MYVGICGLIFLRTIEIIRTLHLHKLLLIIQYISHGIRVFKTLLCWTITTYSRN